jgi:beta-N-acetylhexosaminidase
VSKVLLKLRRILSRGALVIILLFAGLPVSPARAEPASAADAILQAMTPEEKVGQLFLVGFNGAELEPDSPIYNLVTEYHIGGVVLLAENNNFTSEDTLGQTQSLIEALQQLEWDNAARTDGEGADAANSAPSYVPLFVGIPQTDESMTGTALLSGLSQAASQMAIGASWDLDLAMKTGQTLGSELGALGFNLFLGPNLDVLESTSGEAAQYLGVSTFGGDPFWVGEMGKAFINGLHTGSGNQMLVVAQNFPGTGNSDRSPEDEVATVRKSLDQLTQIELAPFFSVTEAAAGDPNRIDAVMVSHIRYQGFQGNIRATTRPISFDANALSAIMALPEIEGWRQNGGLVISDNLGSGAVQRFFDPTGENFEAWQVARNAFLAGNDMLYVNDFVSTSDPNAYTTLQTTLDFFVAKYREDSAFAQRVDDSVLRILNAKLGLYGEFTLDNVLPAEGSLEGVGEGNAVTFDVAQEAVTMISPSPAEMDTVLPSPPLWYEDIVIFTDVRTAYQCEGCAPVNTLDTGSLSTALLNLYGPQAGGQILQHNLSSYTFTQLTEMLDNVDNNGTNEYVQANLSEAEWVVFNMLDVNPDYPASNVLQRILAERPDLLSQKRVIVFALDSPVYLDSTNISKITAYYAMFSKQPAFIDVAARILMQEMNPQGALPISLSAVGYDLISMTAPDPDQIIRLELVMPEQTLEENGLDTTPGATPTPEPTPVPSFNVGDTITIRTGQIRDHNGHIVPDGTVVRFNFTISGEQPGITQQFDTTTAAGVAYFNYRIEAAGGLEVNAVSEPATQSETLNINIEPDGQSSVYLTSPTPQETPTPTESPTATPTEMSEEELAENEPREGYPTLGEWALGVMVIGLGSVLAFFVGRLWWKTDRWGLRSMLLALIGGLLSYSYLSLGLGGTRYWILVSGTTFVVEVILVGMLIGWIVALVWWMRTEGRYPRRFKK